MRIQNPTAATSRTAIERMPENRGGDITQHPYLLAWCAGEVFEPRDGSHVDAWPMRELTTETAP